VVFGIPLAVGSSALIVSNYIIFAKLGIVNKLITMPLIYTTYYLPMVTWICLGGLRSIPLAIEEAAIIDGCSKTYIIFNLIPRLNKPALACGALFIFVGGWNEFIVPSVLVTSPHLRAIQVATYYFMGFYGIHTAADDRHESSLAPSIYLCLSCKSYSADRRRRKR
jgi:ABC-type glycerol-3-phosphate transport system permease component